MSGDTTPTGPALAYLDRLMALVDKFCGFEQKEIRAWLSQLKREMLAERCDLLRDRDRLRFLQTASAETLSAMPDWSDTSIDEAIALEAAEKGLQA